MKRTLFLLVCAAAFLSAVPASAHHSFAATYFEDKTMSVEGDLVQFLFRNPHSFVHVEAPDEKGTMQRWAVEWGAGLQLNRQGCDARDAAPRRSCDHHGQPRQKPRRPSSPDAHDFAPEGRLEVGRDVRLRHALPCVPVRLARARLDRGSG